MFNFGISVETGIMHTNAPPDTCMDEFGDCCCNSVAFALSMFCLACQQGKGIDAGAGTYQLYLQGSRPSGHSCSPVVNRSLPTHIEDAVCDQGIKIIDDIYSRTFWANGAWIFEWSDQDIAAAVNDGTAFTRCDTNTSTNASSSSSGSHITSAESPRTTSGVTSSNTAITVFGSTFPTVVSETPSISSGSTSGSSGSHLSKGAIGGIAAASTIVSICAALLVLWYFCNRKKTKREDARLIASRNIRPYLQSAEVAGPLLAGEIVTPIPTRRPRKPERDSPMPGHQTRRPQLTLDNLDRQSNSISSQPDITSDPVIFSPLRHTDAGPVVEDRMSENSRSLPPAYGDQSGIEKLSLLIDLGPRAQDYATPDSKSLTNAPGWQKRTSDVS
ncbi:hypothetical protein EV360DRAFT_82383 [Lentinula raphanica]|nr:hypothetical protein EV360DRAFT_82383 [Lentinula raphanica]